MVRPIRQVTAGEVMMLIQSFVFGIWFMAFDVFAQSKMGPNETIMTEMSWAILCLSLAILHGFAIATKILIMRQAAALLSLAISTYWLLFFALRNLETVAPPIRITVTLLFLWVFYGLVRK